MPTNAFDIQERLHALDAVASPLESSKVVLSNRDIRSKRPPALSFLLRWETVRRLGRILLLMGLDFAGIFAAIFTALAIKAVAKESFVFDQVISGTREVVAFAYLLTVLLFARSDLYSHRGHRPGFTKIVASLFGVAVVAFIFGAINNNGYSSYYIFYGSLIFALIYVSLFRYLFDLVSGVLLRAAGYRRRVLLVGSGRHLDDVAAALADGQHSSMEVVGFISLAPRIANSIPSLGDIKNLDQIVVDNGIEEVIIADPDFPQYQALDLVDSCHQRGVGVKIAPSTMELLVQRAEFVPGQSLPLFELKSPVFDGFDFIIKRSFDIVVASLTLLVISPLLMLIALAVKLTSAGPVIYRSKRPGLGGDSFDCLKFRTMYQDAESVQEELEQHNEADGALFKIRKDPRVTPVGRLLRRYSLDELPQLWNVLRAEMSLVGPRPLPQRDFDRLEDWHKKRYMVLPGVTGLWQVSGRSDLDFDDLVRLDFFYLESWSVFLDMTILLKTIPAVIFRRGAF